MNDSEQNKIRIGSIAVCKTPNTKYFDIYKKVSAFSKHFEDISFRMRYFLWEFKMLTIPTCKCGCGKTLKQPWKHSYIQGHSNSSELVKQKKISTCLKNYGTTNPSKSSDIIIKREETSLKKFGVKHAAQNVDIKQKTKEYFQSVFGVDNPAKNDDIRKTISQNVKKSRPIVRDLIKKKLFITSYNKIINGRLKDILDPLFTIDEYSGVTQNYKFKCKKCDNIFYSDLDDGKIPRCFECFPRIITNGYSNAEKELFDYVKTLDQSISGHNRTIINPFELDMVSEKHKIAVEFHGLYWHSERSGNKSKNYHVDKMEKSEKVGYRLIQIFEDEWKNKRKIVKSRLRHIFHNHKRKIFARKCEILSIDSNNKKKFLEKYHIQGNDNSSIFLGLYYKNRLVSVMTFSNLRISLGYKSAKTDVFELVRFASISNFNIIGGASKLLKHFERLYNPIKVISYADLRWSNGNLYNTLGFIDLGKTNPNYWYIEKSTRFHRFKFRKSEQSRLLKTFDKNLTEWENMQINGYDRIWDCGSIRFEKVYCN